MFYIYNILMLKYIINHDKNVFFELEKINYYKNDYIKIKYYSFFCYLFYLIIIRLFSKK